MLNIAVCDDLKSDRLSIEKFTDSFFKEEDIEINIKSFENGESLVRYYSNGQIGFDIIFLDIYMKGINGIKSAEQIREYDSDCKIIFTTSSSEHALESFKVFPYNYLTKPISKSTLASVLDKAVKTLNKEKQKSLLIKDGAYIQTILFKDILFIESNARILNIHTAACKSFSFKSKLDDIEKKIADKRFLRCHKSYLVNMDYVSCVEDYSFKLNNYKQIPITQRYFAGIKKAFYDYIMAKADLK